MCLFSGGLPISSNRLYAETPFCFLLGRSVVSGDAGMRLKCGAVRCGAARCGRSRARRGAGDRGRGAALRVDTFKHIHNVAGNNGAAQRRVKMTQGASLHRAYWLIRPDWLPGPAAVSFSHLLRSATHLNNSIASPCLTSRTNEPHGELDKTIKD